MKKTTYTLFLLFAFTFAHAQNDIKARIEFEEAEKAFEAEEYEKSLNHLKETEKLIGQWSPITSFLKIEALHAITDMGNYNNPNTQSLYIEAGKYMAYMDQLERDKIPIEKYKKVYEIEKILKEAKEEYDENQMPEVKAGWQYYEEGNIQKAITEWEKAAGKGNASAMEYIGNRYSSGEGIAEDEDKAIGWYLKAAERGRANSMNNIGVYFSRKGDGVKAMEWYLKASDKGSTSAMMNIAYRYQNGNGMEKDNLKAMEWFLKAADKGNALGYVKVADIYKEGKDVDKDFKKAEEYYLKAMKKNSGEAMYGLGSLYHNGGNGLTQNLQTAMKWYLKAVEKMNPVAMYNIGWIYQNGQGGYSKDYKKAEEWYLKAVTVSSPTKWEYKLLGDLYSLSDNNQPKKALEFYEKYAEAGYYKGMLEAANIYYSGKGSISKDYAKAATYYEAYFNNKERDKENDTYIDNLINIYNRGGYGVEKDKEKAKYWKNFKR